jgi:hypothetical protein
MDCLLQLDLHHSTHQKLVNTSHSLPYQSAKSTQVDKRQPNMATLQRPRHLHQHRVLRATRRVYEQPVQTILLRRDRYPQLMQRNSPEHQLRQRTNYRKQHRCAFRSRKYVLHSLQMPLANPYVKPGHMARR